jgi:DNA-binding HxlR family transcriptional regulator
MRFLSDTWYSKGTSTSLGVVDDTSSGRIDITPAHREVLGHVLDTWSVLVLEELCEAPRRFNQLRRLIPVTQKSLTATLRRLERTGLVERTVISDRPVAVEYRISPLGKTLREPIDALLRWCDEHVEEIAGARDRFDAATERLG